MSDDYKPKMPLNWWLKKPAYFLYMVREVTSVFIAAYCAMLVLGLARLLEGPEAWGRYLEVLQTPGCVAFHAVALVLAVFHSVTWFALTPKVMVVQMGEERVPGALIAGGHFAAWIVVSALLVWLIVGG